MPTDAFSYRDGELYCEQVPLRRLAGQFGTPLYVYSQGHLTDRFDELDEALGDLDHLICYAVKANSNLAILRALANRGAGFDIVSGGELYRVIQAGGEPGRCVFSGVGKTREEIAYALKMGIHCFNVESEPELSLIAEVARRQQRRAPVALRVNPGVDPRTHRYISTGQEASKFGIALERAMDVYRQAARLSSLEIRGLQMHIGSQIISSGPFVKAIQRMRPLIERVRALAPATLKFFDIGGGLGIRYRNERPPGGARYAAALVPHLKDIGLRILTEPGRFIVGNSGVLVTRVLYVKRTPVKNFVITDGAMNDLIRPALYGSWHKILPVRAAAGRGALVADVVGPVCETGDFFAQNRRLSGVVEDGALLAIGSVGAYGMVMASNYNARPRPAEVLVKGRRYELVRSRESMKDLINGEMVAQWLM
jgi:diaminopimelate decarboxylase